MQAEPLSPLRAMTCPTGGEAWILCPVCRGKTRLRVYPDTLLLRFPLFCPKCRRETLINVEKLNITVI